MRTLILFSVVLLASAAFSMRLKAQTTDPAFVMGEFKPVFTEMAMPFKEQTAKAQEYILNHPEIYQVLENGKVAIVGDEKGLLGEYPAELKSAGSLENEGSIFPLTVIGLVDHAGSKVLDLRISPLGVHHEGELIAEIEGNSLSKFMTRLEVLKGSQGIQGIEVDGAYANVTVKVSGISTAQFLEELKKSLEVRL